MLQPPVYDFPLKNGGVLVDAALTGSAGTLLQQRDDCTFVVNNSEVIIELPKPFVISCDLIQSIRVQHLDMAMYSASVVEIAVLFQFL
ncbi:hypothetical protein Tco_1177921 [Tanacetum coccineum]